MCIKLLIGDCTGGIAKRAKTRAGAAQMRGGYAWMRAGADERGLTAQMRLSKNGNSSYIQV